MNNATKYYLWTAKYEIVRLRNDYGRPEEQSLNNESIWWF